MLQQFPLRFAFAKISHHRLIAICRTIGASFGWNDVLSPLHCLVCIKCIHIERWTILCTFNCLRSSFRLRSLVALRVVGVRNQLNIDEFVFWQAAVSYKRITWYFWSLVAVWLCRSTSLMRCVPFELLFRSVDICLDCR